MALRTGSRFPVSMHDVFPHGCCLVPDSIAEAQDYDEKTKRRTPSIDKVTGTKVWQCRVSDLDRMPAPPTRQPFELVEFDGLVVTPYVTDRGKLAFSLRATGIKAAARPAGSKDAA
jgi:hypothetical protein